MEGYKIKGDRKKECRERMLVGLGSKGLEQFLEEKNFKINFGGRIAIVRPYFKLDKMNL